MQPHKKNHHHESAEHIAATLGLPPSVAQSTLVTYRSVGIGVFGAVMRYGGMPLEKIALFMNSSQVSGQGQFRQAVQLTFKEGYLAPYRVVGKASLTAWFLQYSVMGVAFQFFDQGISQLLGVSPVWYGKELMSPAVKSEHHTFDYKSRQALAHLTSPILASILESAVSNRAEVQRYFGPTRFATLEAAAAAARGGGASLSRLIGPAFLPNAMRNVIMCQTSFLLTPITYKLYFPQDKKNKTSLFWYGLSLNIFVGNVVAITQQALWGRSLDYWSAHGQIRYRETIRQGFQADGLAAFFTLPKWFSRVLMNAPAQGTLPWFYNEILPLGERATLTAVKTLVYDRLVKEQERAIPGGSPTGTTAVPLLQRRRSSLGSLATAHPELNEEDDLIVTVQRKSTKELEAFSSAHSEFRGDEPPSPPPSTSANAPAAAFTANSPRYS
jgi:hypothetical protein